MNVPLVSYARFTPLYCHPRTQTLDGTPRPANTQLDVRQTEALFEGSGFEGLGWSVFEDWWAGYLGKSAGPS